MAEVTELRANDDPSRRLRVRLAACVRLLHMEGLVGVNGHVSARLPGRDAFLIHSLIEPRPQVSPDSLLVVDFDGATIEGPAGVKPPSERFIHSEIFRARPDVAAIAHLHSEYAIAFTLAKGAVLRPMRVDAVRFAAGIPVHADGTRIRNPQQGRELAATLGAGSAALMRAHGSVVAAESIPAVLAAAIHFEENARAQHLAAALGEVVPIEGDEMDELKESCPPEFMAHYANKIWRYYLAQGIAGKVIPAEWEELIG